VPSDRKNSGTVILARPVGMEQVEKPQGEACLILIHPPGPDIGRRTPLTNESYVFGREAGVDLIIGRSSVSRRHAELVRDQRNAWFVRDLGSTNGTFVNERKIDYEALRDGDQLRLGDAIFKFLAGTNIEAAYHEEIYRMTIVDGLTGVNNKRYFLDFLERELASAHRHQHPLTLVMMDLDHFKSINDQRGHLAGDAVLKEMSNRVRPRIRREDLFARYGGEEFAAVLTVTPLEGGLRFAEHVRNLMISTPFMFDGQQFPVTISLGVAAVFHEPAVDVNTLIKRADDNLYEAKRRGRNQVVPPFTGA
jgi:two-component system, cell cycle response regulator